MSTRTSCIYCGNDLVTVIRQRKTKPSILRRDGGPFGCTDRRSCQQRVRQQTDRRILFDADDVRIYCECGCGGFTFDAHTRTYKCMACGRQHGRG